MDRTEMEPSARRRAYWRSNLRLTGALLAIWFVATFVVAWYARELAALDFAGWPFPFYMAAQGSLIVYVLIVWYYARRMRQLDKEFGVAEEEGR